MARVAIPSVIESKRPKFSPDFDFSTLSNYKYFQVKHTVLDLDIKFDAQKVVGTVSYDLHTLQPSNKIVLDTSFLIVHSVTVNGDKATYKTRERVEPLGSALEIDTSFAQGEDLKLVLNYETTKESSGTQWLKNDKSGPDSSDYIFTQFEPIHARSFFPSFDTPSVKSTYSATIKSKYQALFTGLPTKSDTEGVYKFEQRIPIPSYLTAVAAGDIVNSKVGPRSTLYASPHLIDDVVFEFKGDLENFLQKAESIVTPYSWDQYDALVLPESFPFGGMENCNMTFLTPTLIAGDKSQVDVVAHELAHSWSGNLVTNATWEHFWLNEGWTVYLERRITGSIHGELSRQFSFLMGWNDLVGAIEELPKFEYSCLVQDLEKGRIDPDETFSSVPYEKGSNFIYHLETKLGGVKEFDPFIKHYFTKFAKTSVDTFQFVDTLYEFYSHDESKIAALNSIDWKLWFYTPGLPPKADFDATLANQVIKLSDEWISKASQFTLKREFEEYFGSGSYRSIYEGLLPLQKIHFIDLLMEKQPNEQFWSNNSVASDSLISTYDDLSITKNTEIKFRWFKLKLISGKTQYHQDLADWLGTVGRMKYVRPSYRLLNKVNRDLAVKTFLKYEDFYHPICAKLVKKDLGL